MMEKMMQRRNALGLIGSGIVGMVGLSTSAWAQATGDMAPDLAGDNGYHLAGNARERAGHGCGQVRHAKDLRLWPRRNFSLCR